MEQIIKTALTCLDLRAKHSLGLASNPLIPAFLADDSIERLFGKAGELVRCGQFGNTQANCPMRLAPVVPEAGPAWEPLQKLHKYVLRELRDVVEAADERTVKVILETCLLTREEKIRACQLVVESGAHFVKTSTGFSTSGATVEDVQLMRETVGPKFGVKASGGIRDLKTALAMIAAGATRLGTSASVAIVKGLSASGSGY